MIKYWYSDGTVLDYLDENRVLHRVGGPAIERDDGNKEWYQNGELHRLDGPAIVHPSFFKQWYQNDKLHRLDGPAVELIDGSRAWFINDKKFSKKEFEKTILVMKLSGLLNG